MQFPLPRLAAAVLIALGVIGCASLPRAIVPCPLTYSEQEKELLTVVPKGIRREEALRRLTAAGVEGSFGISHRVYYCDLWNRPNGERWHINVALLFDDVGKLYKTQMAECDVSTVPQEESQRGSAQSRATSAKSPATSAESAAVNPLN
jgi:hypothetical protein